jgi:hypothetical protein
MSFSIGQFLFVKISDSSSNVLKSSILHSKLPLVLFHLLAISWNVSIKLLNYLIVLLSSFDHNEDGSSNNYSSLYVLAHTEKLEAEFVIKEALH